MIPWGYKPGRHFDIFRPNLLLIMRMKRNNALLVKLGKNESRDLNKMSMAIKRRYEDIKMGSFLNPGFNHCQLVYRKWNHRSSLKLTGEVEREKTLSWHINVSSLNVLEHLLGKESQRWFCSQRQGVNKHLYPQIGTSRKRIPNRVPSVGPGNQLLALAPGKVCRNLCVVSMNRGFV